MPSETVNDASTEYPLKKYQLFSFHSNRFFFVKHIIFLATDYFANHIIVVINRIIMFFIKINVIRKIIKILEIVFQEKANFITKENSLLMVPRSILQ